MKRSEAIKQLKYWLYGASNNPEHQNEAEALLNKIEDMGFLPPFNLHSFMLDGDNADKKSISYRTWEKEKKWDLK